MTQTKRYTVKNDFTDKNGRRWSKDEVFDGSEAEAKEHQQHLTESTGQGGQAQTQPASQK